MRSRRLQGRSTRQLQLLDEEGAFASLLPRAPQGSHPHRSSLPCRTSGKSGRNLPAVHRIDRKTPASALTFNQARFWSSLSISRKSAHGPTLMGWLATAAVRESGPRLAYFLVPHKPTDLVPALAALRERAAARRRGSNAAAENTWLPVVATFVRSRPSLLRRRAAVACQTHRHAKGDQRNTDPKTSMRHVDSPLTE